METLCMDVDQLIYYIEGYLDIAERNRIETHLSECDMCLETFALTKINLKETKHSADSPNEVLSELKAQAGRVMRWISDVTPPVWVNRYKAARVRKAGAGSRGVLLKKQMSGLQTEIYIVCAGQNAACMWVQVFDGKNAADNITFMLARDGGRPAARFVSEGYEVFDRVRFGAYRLMVSRNTRELGEYRFSITQDGVYTDDSQG